MRAEFEDILFATAGESFANKMRREAGVKTPIDESHALKGIAEYANSFSGESFWDSNLTEALGYIARQHGTLNVERFLEHLAELPRDENDELLGVKDYTDLTKRAFQHLGRKVGAQFARSYPDVITQDISPNQYFTSVEQAVDHGGKTFAQNFAYYLPHVLQYTDIDDFRLASTSVSQNSNLPMARTFMQHAAEVARISNAPLQTAAQTTIESLDRLGVDATRWGFPGIQLLSTFGDYPPDEYMADAEEVGKNLDPSYTSWFTRGLLSLGEAQRLTADLPEKGHYMDVINGEIGFRFFAYPAYQASDRQALLSPKQFKDSFMRMAHLGKKSAAVLYARIFDPMNMLDTEDLLYTAHATLGPKHFREASWLLQQTASRGSVQPIQLRKMVEELIEFHHYGHSELIEEVIAYNAWILRHKGAIGYIHLPQQYARNIENSEQILGSVYGYLAPIAEDEEMPFE